jgi:hypothetical protein
MDCCKKCCEIIDGEDIEAIKRARGMTAQKKQGESMSDFEMANGNDPEDIISAANKALVKAMRNAIVGMKEDINQPGLTWEQLDYVLDTFEKKKATVIYQDEPL